MNNNSDELNKPRTTGEVVRMILASQERLENEVEKLSKKLEDNHHYKELKEENKQLKETLSKQKDEFNKELNKQQTAFEVFKATDKANKDSDKRWMYVIIFITSIASFLLSNFIFKA